MRVALFGLDFKSGNMGCQALAYSFYLNLPEMITDKLIECYIFIEGDKEDIVVPECKNVKYRIFFYKVKNWSQLKQLKNNISQCDYVVDFTQGDSFSDIYGLKRMLRVSLTKIIAIKLGTPLILGPQTYGPYKGIVSKILAKYIFQNAWKVCSRDLISAEVVKDLCGRKIEVFTDIAFMLPFEKKVLTDKKTAGINVSGLLWSGGYNQNNQFGIKVDYKEYIQKIIEYLYEKGYEIHLIPHVITKNENNVENDMNAIKQVNKQFPYTIVAESFCNPVDAKSYISGMNIFIGARMHATIGALSSKVPTIPFSYSKKFEGLFESVEYPYTIKALDIDTKEAYLETVRYIDEVEEIKKNVEYSSKIVDLKIIALKEWFASIFTGGKK